MVINIESDVLQFALLVVAVLIQDQKISSVEIASCLIILLICFKGPLIKLQNNFKKKQEF